MKQRPARHWCVLVDHVEFQRYLIERICATFDITPDDYLDFDKSPFAQAQREARVHADSFRREIMNRLHDATVTLPEGIVAKWGDA